MNVQLAVFDLAGTTVNDPDGVCNCIRDSLLSVGVEAERDAINRLMGIPKPMAIRQLIEASGRVELLDRVPEIHDDFSVRMIEFYRTSSEVYEIPGTSEVFKALQEAGIKVAVNTGFDRKITQVLLDRMGWEKDGLIDLSIATDEVSAGRPAPDMIHALMSELGITDPQAVAKIGDTPADIQEGVNAECGLIVGVTEGSHTEAQLRGHGHHHLIGSVTELPGLLGL